MGLFDFLKKKELIEPYFPFIEKKIIKGKLNNFIDEISKKSLIVLITGKRGSGKTSLGMKLLELVDKKTKRKCYIVGYDKIKLPSFIKKTEDIEKVPNNSVCLIDEGAILFSSRESMNKSHKFLSNIMTIARHKNLALFLIVQNSAMIDVNVLRLTDVLIFKEPSLLQTKFERKGIKELYEKAIVEFEKQENKKRLCYIIEDDFEGLLEYNLPEFWSDKISTGFSNFKNK
jgi:hypothetical protein